MQIFINGRFLTQKITGVQRYAIEVVKELDKMNIKEKFVLLHPKNIINNLELKNIELKEIGILKGHAWEQISLPMYLMRHKKAKLINFCNVGPILKPGYVVIHDIAFKTHFHHLNWKFRILYKVITKLNINRYDHIFTVSQFSKNEILDNYRIHDAKITVTYNSANHMLDIEEDVNILNKLNLKDKNFYFSLGSNSSHKNHKFIEECAIVNPEELFVISGNNSSITFKDTNNKQEINNLLYTGYLTDNELATLYKSCKAFIFPSLYEGFGIPPLESIVLGCKSVILSELEVFKEIFGIYVNYIKTNKDFIINKEKLNIILTDEKKIFIQKYKWENIAHIILEVCN